MIHLLEITNAKKSPISYLEDGIVSSKGRKYTKESPNFRLQKRYEFKEGVNILVGSNGSGKSTLLNLIKHYTLCKKSFASTVENVRNISFCDYFNSEKFLDGVKIVADYRVLTFNLRGVNDMENHDTLNSLVNLGQAFYSKRTSDGEKNMDALGLLFKEMFGGTNDGKFPMEEIKKLTKGVNDLWVNRIKALLQYYEANQKDGKQFTILMDEPDRNLDLINSKQVYHILSKAREDTQIIAAIHNPIMIYKLSKLENVNIIELTENYVKDIVEFIEN